MDLPQLTDEQLERVREFFTSDTANLLWHRLEQSIVADWVVGSSAEAREKHWQELQAVLRLQAILRDAKSDKRLTQRSQNIRATNIRTDTVRPV